MEQNPQKYTGKPKTDNLFFVAILFALIGCTLFSGGTAVMLAAGMLNEAPVNVAEAR